MAAKDLEKAEQQGLLEFSDTKMINMVCFDYEQKIKKYDTAEEILDDFYPNQLIYNQKRKVGSFFIELCCSGVPSAMATLLHWQLDSCVFASSFHLCKGSDYSSAANPLYALILLIPSIGFHNALSSGLYRPALHPPWHRSLSLSNRLRLLLVALQLPIN
jgi:hypothetical protein